MNRFSKGLALTLAVGLIGAQTIAFSSNPQQTTSKPQTMVEWVKAHPNATVEYQYPGMKLAGATTKIATSELKNGTPVVIRLTDSVSSNSASMGTNVSFQVVGDVKQDGKIFIRAGEMGTAQVTALEANGMLGQAGKVVISDFSTRAVDGSFVPLRATLSAEGKEKMGVSIIVSWLICPLFLLMKGGEGEIPAGTEKTVYVAADVDVAV